MELILGVHCHQPIGNFGQVFEEAYHKCYKPYFDLLKEFPEIQTVAHFSGSLLDWIVREKPAFIDDIRKLVDEGRVEIVGSGFYEPILPLIPESDAIRQIRRFNDYLKTLFGSSPKGLWLTERVWETRLINILIEAGIDYLFVDDHHFYLTGLKKAPLHGFYITEDNRRPLKLFPIDQNLRYMTPTKLPEEIIPYLRTEHEKDPHGIMTLCDDAEKYGLWPGTYKWVFEERWLWRFFSAIQEHSQWLKTATPGNLLTRHHAQGSIYLPSASYSEMMKWASLAAADSTDSDNKAAIGIFRNFFVKHPESNHMHKRMLEVAAAINQFLPGQSAEHHEATDYCDRAQCNCAYWRGVFGGLYLPHLRSAIYENILKAERLVERHQHKAAHWVESFSKDFDLDGNEELYLKNPYLTLIVAPHQGGMIRELDFKPAALNLTNTVAPTTPTEHAIPYYPRGILIDHILPLTLTPSDYRNRHYPQSGILALQAYDHTLTKTPRSLKALLTTRHHPDSDPVPLISISKTIELSAAQSGFEATYEIRNVGKSKIANLKLGIECNIQLPVDPAIQSFFHVENADLSQVRLRDEFSIGTARILTCAHPSSPVALSLAFSIPFEQCWATPLVTITKDLEGHTEESVQGFTLLPLFPLSLAAHKTLTLSIKVEIANSSC